MGYLLALPSFVKVFPEVEFDLTEAGQQDLMQGQKRYLSTIPGVSVASYNVDCLCRVITTVWIGDVLGRRRTIFLGSSIMVVGAALQCSAVGLAHFIQRVTGKYMRDRSHVCQMFNLGRWLSPGRENIMFAHHVCYALIVWGMLTREHDVEMHVALSHYILQSIHTYSKGSF